MQAVKSVIVNTTALNKGISLQILSVEFAGMLGIWPGIAPTAREAQIGATTTADLVPQAKQEGLELQAWDKETPSTESTR
jgi:hypothetical protein